jgi:hypothetical protein
MNEISTWIPVGDLGTAFEENPNTLPPTSDLEGRALRLHFEDGRHAECRFDSASQLSWFAADAPHTAQSMHSYVATRIRQGVYFIDFVRQGTPPISTSLVVDTTRNIFTLIAGQLPSQSEAAQSLLDRALQAKPLTGVAVEFSHGSIGTPCGPTTPRHAPTLEARCSAIAATTSGRSPTSPWARRRAC